MAIQTHASGIGISSLTATNSIAPRHRKLNSSTVEGPLASTVRRKNAILAYCLSLGTYLFLWRGLPEDFLEKEKRKQIKFSAISREGSESLLVLSAPELSPTLPSSFLPLLIQPVISPLNHKNGNPIGLAGPVLLLWFLHNPVAKEPSLERHSDRDVPIPCVTSAFRKKTEFLHQHKQKVVELSGTNVVLWALEIQKPTKQKHVPHPYPEHLPTSITCSYRSFSGKERGESELTLGSISS